MLDNRISHLLDDSIPYEALIHLDVDRFKEDRDYRDEFLSNVHGYSLGAPDVSVDLSHVIVQSAQATGQPEASDVIEESERITERHNFFNRPSQFKSSICFKDMLYWTGFVAVGLTLGLTAVSYATARIADAQLQKELAVTSTYDVLELGEIP